MSICTVSGRVQRFTIGVKIQFVAMGLRGGVFTILNDIEFFL